MESGLAASCSPDPSSSTAGIRPDSPLTRIFWLFLALYLAILPISHTTGLRNVAFVGLIACTAWLAVRHTIRWQLPLLPSWLFYALVALFSLVYAVEPAYSLGEIKTEILYGFLIFSMAANWIRGARALDRLAGIAAAANTFLVCYTFYLVATARPTGRELIGSFNAASGTYSTYVVTIVPIIAALACRKWYASQRRTAALLGLLVIADLGALYFTLNRQSFLAIGASCAAAGLVALRQRFSWRGMIIGLMLLAAMVALFIFQLERRAADIAVDPRWRIWSFALDRIAERPLAGGGFGREAFDLAYPDFKGNDELLWHAHNMVLNKGIQMGIPGITAFLILLFAALRMLAQGLRARLDIRVYSTAGVAMCAAVFVKNMTDDFFVRDNALLFWLLSGAIIGAIRGWDGRPRLSHDPGGRGASDPGG